MNFKQAVSDASDRILKEAGRRPSEVLVGWGVRNELREEMRPALKYLSGRDLADEEITCDLMAQYLEVGRVTFTVCDGLIIPWPSEAANDV